MRALGMSLHRFHEIHDIRVRLRGPRTPGTPTRPSASCHDRARLCGLPERLHVVQLIRYWPTRRQVLGLHGIQLGCGLVRRSSTFIPRGFGGFLTQFELAGHLGFRRRRGLKQLLPDIAKRYRDQRIDRFDLFLSSRTA